MKSFLLFALLALSVTACKKDKEPAGTILLAHKWRFDQFWQYSKPVVLPDCAKDDSMVFGAAGGGYDDYGPLLCIPASPQKRNFTWSLAAEEDRLTIDHGGSVPITYQVISIDHSSLVIETYFADRSRYSYIAY